jgi:glycosyltransferase involved in cell wall biosynthesis
MVVHLSLELMRVGVQTGVVSFFDVQKSQLERVLRSNGVPVWSLGKHIGPDLAAIRNLRKLLVALRPQVIHTHLSALRYAVAGTIGITHPPRIVHTIHRVAKRDSEFGLRWLQRWCLRRSFAVIAVSEQVAKSCARAYHRLPVSVIPNGIPDCDGASSPDARARTRRALGIHAGCFVFCCVANLRAVKNHKVLLQAFAEMAGETGARLLLAGDGELRAELEALARSLRIQEQTHFLGEREDISELLAASDAFVLPSVSEGTPLSVLEAMMAGLPIIATSVGGLPELVRSGSEGLLVPPGNIHALREAMARIIADADSRSAMSRASRQRAAARFDSNVMARSYLSVYMRRSEGATAGIA